MYEELQSLHPADRPSSLNQWTLAGPHLRSWKSARWLVLMLFAVAASAVASGIRGLPGLAAIFIALAGPVVALALFGTIASGISSSNWGIYFRRREPLQFWVLTGIWGLAYLGIALMGWLLAPNLFLPRTPV